jgi:hypothetical protein
MSDQPYRPAPRRSKIMDLLSLDRLMTGSLIHLVYWLGLGFIFIIGFGGIGAAVGIALREPGVMSIMAAVPALIGGVLALVVLGLLWRSFCEFYVVIFRISDDLHALRRGMETEQTQAPAAAPGAGAFR